MTDTPFPDPIAVLRDELLTQWSRVDVADIRPLDIDMAGLSVRIELTGQELERLTLPAFELHPRSAIASPDITIRVLDCAATGTPLPPSLAAMAPGTRWRSGPGDRATQLMWDGMYCAIAEPATGSHMVAMPDARLLPWWEQGAPIRLALAWALAAHDRWFVHAAAVGRPDGVVLLGAPSGHGKSSTAVSALLAGHHFLGDDLAILTSDGRVHPLYGTVKVKPADLRVIDPEGRLAAHTVYVGKEDGPTEEKTVAVASRVAPELMLTSASVAAVVVPSLAGPAGCQPISRADALRHLAPTTVFMLRSQGGRDFAACAELVRQVPCHRLGLVPDRAANLVHLTRLLDEVVAPVGRTPA